MRTLLIATALMMFISGSAFAKEWKIELEAVDVPAEKCGETLENGTRFIPWELGNSEMNKHFWYDGLVWEIWYDYSYDGFIVCEAFKPVWGNAR